MIQITQTISPNSYFKLSNGQIIKNLKELPDIIQRLDEHVFRSHVNDSKNDFAAWIYNVFRLDDLSSKLGPVKSKEEIVRIIKAYLQQQSPIKPKTPVQKPPVTAQPVHTIKQPEPFKPNVQPVPQKPKQKKPQVYIWKSNESQTLDQRPRPKVKTQFKKEEPQPKKLPEVKKPEIKKPVPETVSKPVPKTTNQPVKQKMSIKRPQANQNITNAEEYFQKNPMLISQVVEAKKHSLMLEPLEPMVYTGDETPERLIEIFNDTYSEAYERLTFLRKNGFDTSLAEIMLFRIPTKIKVYGTSKQSKDSIVVKRYLNEIIEELNNMKA